MSARIFFKDESEIMPSHTGDDVVNHFINVRTPVKFLCHFAHNFLINNSASLGKIIILLPPTLVAPNIFS